jgi:hypothetical protein
VTTATKKVVKTPKTLGACADRLGEIRDEKASVNRALAPRGSAGATAGPRS